MKFKENDKVKVTNPLPLYKEYKNRIYTIKETLSNFDNQYYYVKEGDMQFYESELELVEEKGKNNMQNKEKNQETSFKKGKTSWGFHKIEFKDINGVECSVQESSLATEEAIWLGVDDPDPEILLPNKGWVKYPVLEDVLFKSRMHLSIKQAAQLVRILNKFLETGSVGEEQSKEDVLRGRVANSPCSRCLKNPDENGHDACLGTLKGLMNACCGHGNDKSAYVQFLDGSCVRGKDAITIIKILKTSFHLEV